MSVKGRLKFLLILLLTVGVLCSCCCCATDNDSGDAFLETFSIESTEAELAFKEKNYDGFLHALTEKTDDFENTYIVCKEYSKYLDETFSSTIITRVEWLEMLIDKLGVELRTDISESYSHVYDKNYFYGSEYFVTAIENGMLYLGWMEFDHYTPATKQFVATSLTKSLDYDIDGFVLNCTDYEDIDAKYEAAATVYLDYFELDENGCFNPDDMVTQQQVDYLMSELDIYNKLSGKSILSFGDSIMYGTGNNAVGLSDLIAKRYKMQVTDFAVSGATFGKARGRVQISNQILSAIERDLSADFILLNGGTNDMRWVKPGKMSDDFEYEEHGRNLFANGMEYALGLIKDNFKDSKLVYVRAHDMEFSLERNELHFGEMALDICEKWEVDLVDIFRSADFDAHDEEIRSKYTYHTPSHRNGDSVHPNREGYYEFYVPLTVEKMLSLCDAKEN